MRAVTIPNRGFGRGEKCADCRRTLKAGECGISHRVHIPTTHRGYVYLWWHKTCVEGILEAAPLDADEVQIEFERLRSAAVKGELNL